MTVENVRAQKRFHPRCGTSFLVLMLLVGIVVSMFIRVDNPFLRTGLKILTFPILISIGYELIQYAGRHDSRLTRIISAPGVAIQHITTREPDDGMIQCAIESMMRVIPGAEGYPERETRPRALVGRRTPSRRPRRPLPRPRRRWKTTPTHNGGTPWLPRARRRCARFVREVWYMLPISLLVALAVELLNHSSFEKLILFLQGHPWMFLFNVEIIFNTFLFAELFRRRRGVRWLLGILWLVLGAVNAIIQKTRVLPFTTRDVLLIPDGLKMITVLL